MQGSGFLNSHLLLLSIFYLCPIVLVMFITGFGGKFTLCEFESKIVVLLSQSA